MFLALKSLLYFCFFLSGIAGLMYEVLWSRYLGLFIGNSTYAHAVVLAAFMGGLALGNWWLGKKADADPKCLSMYAKLEIGIGIYALLTPLIFIIDRWLYLSVAQFFPIGSWASIVLKLIFAFPVVLIPTTMMGGTLPFMARVFIGDLSEVRREIGALYAINSYGAVVGSLACAFIFIPVLGMSRSLFTAAALNILVGLAVLWIRKMNGQESLITTVISPKTKKAQVVIAAPEKSQQEEVSPLEFKTALWAVAISGGVALVYELGWFRFFALVLGSSTYSFALMLAAFIFGITIGSLIVTFINPGGKGRVYKLLIGCHWALALSMSFSILFYEKIPFSFILVRNSSEFIQANFYFFEFIKYCFTFMIMFIPTTIFGMILPLTTLLVSREVPHLGESVGGTFAVNTLGAMIGSLITGFIFLPYLGLKGTFLVGIILNAILAAVLLWAHTKTQKITPAVVWGLMLGPIFFVSLLGAVTPAWSATVLSSGVFRKDFPYKSWADYKDYRDVELSKKVLFHKDGTQVTVLVGESAGTGARFLKVNGKTDASTSGDVKTQLMLAHLPALLHANPISALNVGIGSGMTAGALLQYPSLERLDIAEISKEVREASVFFKDYNHKFYEDPRTHIYIEDAKTFMQLTPYKYDIIISEPSNPWVSGVASLYTEEFFRQVRSHLNEGGIFTQWFHAYEMGPETSKIIVRTLSRVFPEVSLWSVLGSNDVIFLASEKPLTMDFAAIEKRMQEPSIAAEMARASLFDLPSLLAHEMVSGKAVPKFVGEGLINSDYRPYLEYEAPKDFFQKDRSMHFYYDMDEKLFALNRKELYLNQYLDTHSLTEQNIENLAKTFSDELYLGRLKNSILALWKERYPKSPRLAETLKENKTDLTALEIKAKQLDQERKKYSSSSFYLVNYLEAYFDWYMNTRSIFFGIPMTDWMKLSQEALTSAPEKRQTILRMRALYSRIEG